MKTVLTVQLELTLNEDGTVDWEVLSAEPPHDGAFEPDLISGSHGGISSRRKPSLGKAIDDLSDVRHMVTIMPDAPELPELQAGVDRALAELILARAFDPGDIGAKLSGSGGGISALVARRIERALGDLRPARNRLNRHIKQGSRPGAGPDITMVNIADHLDGTINALSEIRGSERSDDGE